MTAQKPVERWDRQLTCDHCGKVVELVNVLGSWCAERWVCDKCITRTQATNLLFSMDTYQHNDIENERALDEYNGIGHFMEART